jgi:hypothetical protein
MSPSSMGSPLPSATEMAHAPELALLIALDTLLAMTIATLELALPELDLIQRDRAPLDPEDEHRDLIVAQDILDLVETLRYTIQTYRDLVLRP